jgi:hypothetical protein
MLILEVQKKEGKIKAFHISFLALALKARH